MKATTKSGATYSTADLAERWGTNQSKILRFIAAGDLLAINIALDPRGRPRWRIAPEAVEAFERRRSSNVDQVKHASRPRPSSTQRYV